MIRTRFPSDDEEPRMTCDGCGRRNVWRQLQAITPQGTVKLLDLCVTCGIATRKRLGCST